MYQKLNQKSINIINSVFIYIYTYLTISIILFQTQINFEKEHLRYSTGLQDFETLPEQGLNTDVVLKEAKKYVGLGHFDWKTGSESGTVYNGRDMNI